VRHIPVMVEEVIACLGCEPHKTYVDATLGCGGHAREILARTAPDGVLIGIEWDDEALEEARKVLSEFGDRVKLFRDNFTALPEILRSLKIDGVDGVLLDLGLSSLQLERGERGFSFQQEGLLDMRMDRRRVWTAADLVNRLSQREIEAILFEYGEERWAKRIAKAIVEQRAFQPILSTSELRRIVHQAIPRRFHSRRIDPATRTFQALRIKVNEELENLSRFLQIVWSFLKPGGRICVISFHSLEDRLVKESFRNLSKKDRIGGPLLRLLVRKPLGPSPEEKHRNPRCRSAKLRWAERI